MDDKNQNQNSYLVTQEMILDGNVKQRHLFPGGAQVGDIYYGKNGNFKRLGIGSTGQVLTVASGVPAWSFLLTTGVAASRPSSGSFTGSMYFATDTFALSIWTGAAWKSVTLS